jgi:hypothetical protein
VAISATIGKPDCIGAERRGDFRLVEKLAAGETIPRWEESFEDVYDETVAAKVLPDRLY